jgi:hypothetical protein
MDYQAHFAQALANPRSTIFSPRRETDAPKTCWVTRICHCRRLRLPSTKAIWRVTSVRCSASRLDSSGGRNASPGGAPDAVKSCVRSAENKLTSCHATVRLPKSCAWVPTLIRLRLRQRAAVESSQNLGVVMTTLEMLFQNGHECLRDSRDASELL